jgi:hypothetical protein
MKQDYPLNLSILLSGGKETNKDALSNGEWSGQSSTWKSDSQAGFRIVGYRREISVLPWYKWVLLEYYIIEGENPVCDQELAAYDPCSQSRVVWDCSAKWEVNFF